MLSNSVLGHGVSIQQESGRHPSVLTKPVKVHIDTLRTVSADSSGFDLLVLPPEHKKILISQLGSIRKRSLDSAMSGMNIDFVEGKGQGLIILLHGRMPGVFPFRANICRCTGRWQNIYGGMHCTPDTQALVSYYVWRLGDNL